MRSFRMTSHGRASLLLGLLAAMIIAVFLISLNSGSIPLSPLDVLKTLFGGGTQQQETLLFQFRMPRMVIALLIGCGLAVSGVILQGLSRNVLSRTEIPVGIVISMLGAPYFLYLLMKTKT